MANALQRKKETLAIVDAAMTIANKFPELQETDTELSFNISTNPFTFLMDLFKSTSGYDKTISIIGRFIAKGLPLLEASVKALLIAKLKDIISCSVNPFFTDEILREGIVFNVEEIDIADILKYSPLDSKVGKFFYFDNEDIEITCTYNDMIAVTTINISYDNQLTIECADTLTGTSGNAIARYNSTAVNDATWTITSGGTYATVSSTGEITILETGIITLQAEYNDYTATKTINVVYDAGKSSSTEVNPDGSVTTTETTTTTDPETGAVVEETTSTTVNEDGSTSNTTETTTTNQDGSSETTSTTTNQDGTSSETQSSTSAPDPETGAVTTESNTTHYDENGNVSGSSDSTIVENSDGSSTSQVNNYDENGDPTSTTNNEVDTSGNSSTQEIEYDSNGDPVVTGYNIDTTGSSGEGKAIEDGVNTEYYAFDQKEQAHLLDMVSKSDNQVQINIFN